MYRDYFHFRAMPFENTPDPRFFFATAEHEEALAALKYGVAQRRGITVVTGAPGSGKTLLGRMLTRSLGMHARSAFVSHTPDDARDLIASLCREFEVRVRRSHSIGELVARLESMLMQQHHEQALCVAVIDEAQNLPVDLLEHLRMLGNLELDSAKLLQIVLLGQPELGRVLRSGRLKQLRQRVFCSRELAPLARDQTRDYVRHRLEVAGGANADLFAPEALDLIHDRSAGLPRMINQIADNSLLTAYAASRTTIDQQTVAESIDQMMRLQVASSREQTDADHAEARPVADAESNISGALAGATAPQSVDSPMLRLDEALRRASRIASGVSEATHAAARQTDEPGGAGQAGEPALLRIESACRHAGAPSRASATFPDPAHPADVSTGQSRPAVAAPDCLLQQARGPFATGSQRNAAWSRAKTHRLSRHLAATREVITGLAALCE